MRNLARSATCHLLALALAFSLIAGAGICAAWGAPKGARWGKTYFPDIIVTAHDGRKYNFYNDLIFNKIVVIDFIYTACTDICPLTTARLAQVKEKLGDRVGKDIFLYSISLEPERDTHEVLKQYAEAFGAGPGWLFLTGDAKDIYQLRWKLGERSRKLTEHISHVMLGNDATGEWERSSMMSDIDALAHNILSMDPEWRSKARILSSHVDPARGAGAVDMEKRHKGEALFAKACASCHTIGKGKRIGPDLAGVTQRREAEWLKNFIMKPDVMLAQKDPIALELRESFKGVLMPNLSIRESDARDLIDYIAFMSREAARSLTITDDRSAKQ